MFWIGFFIGFLFGEKHSPGIENDISSQNLNAGAQNDMQWFNQLNQR